MSLPFKFDFKNPDYREVFIWRAERLQKIREEIKRDPETIPVLLQYYKANPIQFIIDWGCTYEPRNVSRGLPVLVPMVLFPIQEECLHWILDLWKRRRWGLIEKSRDMGLTTAIIALFDTLALTHHGFNGGLASRKEEYVDKLGSPKALLWKTRYFLKNLPREFRGSWNEKKDSPFKICRIPWQESLIAGEAGGGLGRGDRLSLVLFDEANWIANMQANEASLSQAADTVLFLSSISGYDTWFAKKRFSGNIEVFTAHWTRHPGKDEAWYQETCRQLGDPVIIAQEIDIDYNKSLDNVLIPREWIDAAVDAHIKLNIKITGKPRSGLDIADEGVDKNAQIFATSILVEHALEWSGKNADIYATCDAAMDNADLLECDTIDYDADGLGAGARGDFRKINEARMGLRKPLKICSPYRASGEVVDKELDIYGRVYNGSEEVQGNVKLSNGDYFANAKAQNYYHLRMLFYKTYKAVTRGDLYDTSELISLSSTLPHLEKLKRELTQIRMTKGEREKMVIEKKPTGQASPNLADALVIVFAKKETKFKGFFDV